MSSLLTPEERIASRYDNFYNGYNIISRPKTPTTSSSQDPNRDKGQTVDGQKPTCENYKPQRNKGEKSEKPPFSIDIPVALPPGIKPCDMKLVPPNPCCEHGNWTVKIFPCPIQMGTSKVNKEDANDGVCKVGCKLWKSKEAPCLYDDPCRAHCYNHPPGIKPSGRFP
ncbi:uncharacterized protein LOC108737904 isoform X2 [Agrilus planipennis]|uniref:Uncharacterized protein LOC108737904 isoform X2 n=1 Tax=Agrilus planipennis TaxID=224129 RepID=A0A1W4X2P9_AGRPL|nr:uncharacterized protein LOC108737904 isoform X2 [Agrilus planipennis]